MQTFSPHPHTNMVSAHLKALYTGSFLFAFHVALLAYIESTFLSQFIPEELVGAVFTAASLVAIVILIWIPPILSRIGNYRVMFFLTFLETILLLALAFVSNPALAIGLFIVHAALYPVIIFGLDVFLESNSEDEGTGKIRGMYLTAANAAWVVPPLLTGLILENGDYWKIFLVAALLMVPVIALLSVKFKTFKDPVYNRVPFWRTVRTVMKQKNIYRIFMSNIILAFFFAWMVIYMPLYLHNHIGLEWSEIGVIFSIMLIPFVLVDIPLGKLADLYWGEKELLSAGFILGAVSTALISFVVSTSVFVWAILLFTTRIGMATVQIMNDSYFFKQIDETDTNIISLYRNTPPFAYVFAPLVATAFLAVIEFKYLFLVLAVVVLFGLRYSLALKDTK